jgi:hypothetical protein
MVFSLQSLIFGKERERKGNEFYAERRKTKRKLKRKTHKTRKKQFFFFSLSRSAHPFSL